MNAPAVDTDILIRLLTRDDPAKGLATQALFERVAAGERVVMAPETVIAAAVFVLSSKRLYDIKPERVAELLSHVVRLPGFHVRNRGDVLRALAIFARDRVDFGDAMIVASMERAQSTEIFSYDQDFDRFPHFTRHEP